LPFETFSLGTIIVYYTLPQMSIGFLKFLFGISSGNWERARAWKKEEKFPLLSIIV